MLIAAVFIYVWELLERFLFAFSLLNLVLHLQKNNRSPSSNCMKLNFWQNCTPKSKTCSRFQISKYFSGQILFWFYIGSSSTPQLYPSLLATEIQDLTSGCVWRYVTIHLNSADIVSRGSSVKELSSSIWFTGPEFLTLDPAQWPPNKMDKLS